MKQDLELKTRRSILRGRNGGQAVVEYILIVSIAVALIFIMKGAFSGMNTFINNYLGLYTECLMAHGELPALGVSDSDLKKHLSSDYKCESGFKPFTIGEGRPPVGGASGNGSQASRNGGKSDSNSENASAQSGGSGRNSSKDGDKDKDAVSGNGSGSSPYENGSIKRSGRSSADGIAGASDRSRLIEDDGEGDEIGGGGRKRKPRESRIIYRDRPRYRAILGQEADLIKNQSVRSSIKRKPTSRAIAKADNGGFTGPRSGLMKQPPQKVIAAEETQDEGWGFGKLMKWLFIIGILVALIIFFGGQLMNYSNSDS